MSIEDKELCQTTDSKCDEAIKSAKKEIETLAKKQRSLERSVRIFRMNKRDGVPWPGEEKQDAATN